MTFSCFQYAGVRFHQVVHLEATSNDTMTNLWTSVKNFVTTHMVVLVLSTAWNMVVIENTTNLVTVNSTTLQILKGVMDSSIT